MILHYIYIICYICMLYIYMHIKKIENNSYYHRLINLIFKKYRLAAYVSSLGSFPLRIGSIQWY